MSETDAVSFDSHGRHITLCFPSTSDHIARTIQQTGSFYEAELLADVRARLFFPACAVDVGAHVGNHTVYFAGVLGMRTISFEPNPESFALLETNTDKNGVSSKCELYHAAVGAAAGLVRVVQAPDSNSGMANVAAHPGGEIPAVRLDDVVLDEPAIDIIKIDVEGWELDVLRGAVAVLDRHRPLLYVEIMKPRFAEVQDLLSRHDYVAWKRFNATPTFLFLPMERLGGRGGPAWARTVTH
jgi:FkbM family methyltransferase